MAEHTCYKCRHQEQPEDFPIGDEAWEAVLWDNEDKDGNLPEGEEYREVRFRYAPTDMQGEAVPLCAKCRAALALEAVQRIASFQEVDELW